MKSLLVKFIFISSLLNIGQSYANTSSGLSFDLNNKTTLNYIIDSQIKDPYPYNGLATYLNQVHYYTVDSNQISALDRNNTKEIPLNTNQWLAVVGRFNVLLIKSPDANIIFDENELISIMLKSDKSNIHVLSKSQLRNFAPELDQIRYNHLWKPFSIITKWSESLLVFIKETTSLGWGLAVLIFALVIKLMLLPVSIITSKSQQNVSKIKSQLQPRLAQIKSKYTGEKAHHFTMKAHKDIGVSPFYTLKPMVSFLIQIPILIAIFNALGEMPQLINQPFLWFNDLSQPDSLMSFGFSIPLLGDKLNLMPIIMTLITLTSTVLHTNNHVSKSENNKQKIKLYLMSVSFLILFYPFPVVMVMYWAMANLLGFIQQKFIN